MYDADPSHRFAGVKIEPKPSFFQAEIRNNTLLCHPREETHPDGVRILFTDDKED